MSSEKRLTDIISFGERLAQARTRLNLSQEAVAEAVGTTARSISRWEHNQATPQPYYLERLCEVLQTTPETLCGLNESEQKESAFSEKGDTSSSPTNTLALWTVPYARNRH
ncbi:MAG TPA: helix-turn-helix transcriptional regulator, partial [Ktedonobacteraceae bacterium]|nr:helix-turn-helix transcriptional regulator [Ktedonobacteraceae bacterium]